MPLIIIVCIITGLLWCNKLDNTLDIDKKDSYVTIVQVDTLSVKERALLLKKYAVNISFMKDHQLNFYNVFPNNYEEFKELFGYTEIDAFNDGFGPLYMESEKYIKIFFTKIVVDKKLLINKAINISVQGIWQADGVGFFKIYMMSEVKEHLDFYLNNLAERSQSDILGFWHFYFDGPHPESYMKDYELLYKRVMELDNEIAKLMREAYQELLTSSDEHGH